MRLFIGYKAWKEEEYLLNRMTFPNLVRAYFTYPAIQVYLALIVFSLLFGSVTTLAPVRFLASVGAGALLFPIAWYLIHRFVLHGSWMYRSPHLAKLWKRIHYDHHRFPNDLSVLFGGLHTTLPTILLVAGPAGFLIEGWAGAAGAIAGTLLMTCFTEFMHAGEHLAFEPKLKLWKDMKQRHLAHHFHNERGNFGIAEFFWDRLFGTFYAETADRPRSATARNIGYTDEMAKQFPWVKALSDAESEKLRALRSQAA